MIVLPTILVQTKEEFAERIANKEVRKLAPMWQFDILDGSMYGADSWADFEAVSETDHVPELELDLMIENPVPVVKSWVDHVPSVKRAVVHAEIEADLAETLDAIKEFGVETGLAVDPETNLDDIVLLRNRMDLLLVMGVHPGASGQAFLGEPILEKIRDARHRWPDLPIGVDGGVTLENAAAIVEAGATQLCSGSGVWGADDPASSLKQLQSA